MGRIQVALEPDLSAADGAADCAEDPQHDTDHDEDSADRVEDRETREVTDHEEDYAEDNHGHSDRYVELWKLALTEWAETSNPKLCRIVGADGSSPRVGRSATLRATRRGTRRDRQRGGVVRPRD